MQLARDYKFKFPWEKPITQTIKEQTAVAGIIPVGAVLSVPQKVAIGVGGGFLAGATLLGGKQYLDQQQRQSAKAWAGTQYHFYQTKGGGSQIIERASGGTATVDQTQEQTATQSTPDYLQMLLLGGLLIGALFMLRKK